MTDAYCGRCWFERGQAIKLTMMTPINREGKPYRNKEGNPISHVYGCPFCGEERHEGGSHARTHIVTGGNHAGEESVVKIPHIVALA
jgi:hypothetical protein